MRGLRGRGGRGGRETGAEAGPEHERRRQGGTRVPAHAHAAPAQVGVTRPVLEALRELRATASGVGVARVAGEVGVRVVVVFAEGSEMNA